MPKKKRNKIIVITTISILVFLIVGRLLYMYFQDQNKEITSVNDFNNIKELVEFNDCKYINMESSKEEGYKEDIYIEFSKDPIDENGNTNEILYDNLTSQIAGKLIGTNFRIIDESRSIIIRIQFEENAVSLYTINNDSQYFEHLKTKYQVTKYTEDKQTPIQISSNVLNAIANNNWSTTNLNLGSIDSVYNNYNIYFDEGYKIKNIYSNVYNIIFTKKYQYEVFPGIKVGMTNEQIKEVLGNETFYEAESNVIGYKNEEFYVFFSDGEISIYRNDNDYDTTEFYKILTDYNNTGDYNTFISKLTELWPDYDAFTKTSDRIMLKYTLKGIVVNFNSISNNGITIYKNAKGQLIDEIMSGEVLNNVYTRFDTDLVLDNENSRIIGDVMARDPVDPKEELNTDKYVVLYDETTSGGFQNVRFISRDKENPDIELKDEYINGLYKIDDNNYIYSVQGKGIYRINIESVQYQTIIEGNEAFSISKIENNIIYYDNTQIEIR